jgi:septal ring factor EnvC (AmiA/AmiB activator)
MIVMASKPLEQVTLADLATKDDLKNLATKQDLHREISSVRQEVASVKQEVASVKQEVASIKQEVASVRQELRSTTNLVMGEFGKQAARQEEMAGVLAFLVRKSEGMEN